MTISPNQAKNARRLLGWSITVLATKTGASTTTVSNFENGKRLPKAWNIAKIRQACEDAGVEFIGDAGTKLREAE